MTINAQRTVKQYQGNGVTTSFNYPYQFFAPGDLKVLLFDQNAKALVNPQPVLNGLGTYDYTLDGVLDPLTAEYLNGSNAIFNNPPLGNYEVVLVTAVPETQNLTAVDGAKFPSASMNTELDRLTALCQDLYNMIQWALRLPFTSAQPPVLTPTPNTVIGFDGNGNLIQYVVTVVQTTVTIQNIVNVNASGQISNNAQTVYVDSAGGPINLTLPAGHQDVRIKDKTGHAAANPITITPDTGTIDGAANKVINTNHGSLSFSFDGVNWDAF